MQKQAKTQIVAVFLYLPYKGWFSPAIEKKISLQCLTSPSISVQQEASLPCSDRMKLKHIWVISRDKFLRDNSQDYWLNTKVFKLPWPRAHAEAPLSSAGQQTQRPFSHCPSSGIGLGVIPKWWSYGYNVVLRERGVFMIVPIQESLTVINLDFLEIQH